MWGLVPFLQKDRCGAPLDPPGGHWGGFEPPKLHRITTTADHLPLCQVPRTPNRDPPKASRPELPGSASAEGSLCEPGQCPPLSELLSSST